MKIDVFSHILPVGYREAASKIIPASRWQVSLQVPTLWDLEARFRIIDTYEVAQVLTLMSPGVEDFASPEKATELAKLANDEMAELVSRNHDRFVAAIACIPMNDIDQAIMEIERAMGALGMRGVQLFTSVNGKPLDHPEFFPVYERIVDYNLPIFLHPDRSPLRSEYATEKRSRYNVWLTFGWPYETSIALSRLVFGGVLDKYPRLKVIAHHSCAMISFFAQRIAAMHHLYEVYKTDAVQPKLKRSPIDYFRDFYGDTALCGHTPGLMCAYEFFGPKRILFGTDMPMDGHLGKRFIKDTIMSIERMNIPESEKRLIFEDNARRLLHLL